MGRRHESAPPPDEFIPPYRTTTTCKMMMIPTFFLSYLLLLLLFFPPLFSSLIHQLVLTSYFFSFLLTELLGLFLYRHRRESARHGPGGVCVCVCANGRENQKGMMGSGLPPPCLTRRPFPQPTNERTNERTKSGLSGWGKRHTPIEREREPAISPFFKLLSFFLSFFHFI